MQMSQAAVETVSVTKKFEGVTAVDDVNLVVPTGSVQAIMGRNGAGKSTLLRLMVGVFEPDFGDIRIQGNRLSRDASAVRQQIHYVSADISMYSLFRVRDMMQYAGLLYHRWDEDAAKQMRRELGLSMERVIRSFSLGEMMQLKLTIALAARPDILILDEPTNGLDPLVKQQLLQLLLAYAAESGLTVVMATHQLVDIERLADQVAFMNRGRLVDNYRLDELKESTASIHAIMPEHLNAVEMTGVPGVLRIEQTGSYVNIFAKGDIHQVENWLNAQGFLQIESHPLAFTELFRCLAEKEGHPLDRVDFS